MLEFQGHVGLGCGECQGQFSMLSPCSQNSCLQWMWHLLLQWWLGRLSPLETWIQILAWFSRGKKAGGLDPNSCGISPHNPYTHHSVELVNTPRKVPEHKWKKCCVGDAGSSLAFFMLASSWKLVLCAWWACCVSFPCTMPHPYAPRTLIGMNTGCMSCIYNTPSEQWREIIEFMCLAVSVWVCVSQCECSYPI